MTTRLIVNFTPASLNGKVVIKTRSLTDTTCSEWQSTPNGSYNTITALVALRKVFEIVQTAREGNVFRSDSHSVRGRRGEVWCHSLFGTMFLPERV